MSASPRSVFPEFPVTRWSVVGVEAVGRPVAADTGREHFCQSYWKPLYAYARARGQSPADAEDLTQAFVVHFMERGGVETATPKRGSFRSLLRSSFRNFMTAQWRRSSRLKRGGPHGPVPLEVEAELSKALSNSDAAPDALFDRCWAQSQIDAALDALAALQAQRGAVDAFAILRPFLTCDGPGASLRDAAAKLGISYEAARRRLTRLRIDFRRLLREEVASTLGMDDDLDTELRYLISCLRHGP